MIIVNKEEFKTLLENNPGKKFAFVEWEPRIANSNLHITDGDIKYPLFGASTISYDPTEPNFVFDYDWNLLEYSEKDQFAILVDDEIKELIEWLKETLSDEDKQ